MRWLQTAIVMLFASTIGAAICPAEEKIPLVDINKIDPTIVVDLRYATKHNIAGRKLYPAGMPAFVRPEVAPRLRTVQKFLRQYDLRLKIWDAYRPPSAQRELWRKIQNDSFVANPDAGAGSMHSWGVAVDCTLADLHNRSVAMPTDFDDFTPAAMSYYTGADPRVRTHLRLLQVAMAGAGFYGFRSEWWHFTVKDWEKYLPPEEVKRVNQMFGNSLNEKL
jgi:zinc D-Ala-D-Ala dipeptidase